MYHAPCRHTNDRNGAAASAPADPGGCPHDVRQLGQRPGRDPLAAVGAPQKRGRDPGTAAAWALLYPNGDYYQWAIVEKSTRQVFGSIGVFTSSSAEPERDPWPGFDHTNGVWEVGYCIGKAWWNKGFTTEALKAVVEYWFKNTDSSWLACCHAFENPASGRVQQKAGFVYDHDAVYHKFNGTPVACRCYALTREHYEELRGLF